MMAPFSGSYLARPTRVLVLTVAVVLGQGTFTTTLLALRFLSKMDLTLTLISILFPLISLQTGMILKGRLMFWLIRQDMSSNDPSGGMKVMDLSLSNLGSLTHWWNFISSIVIPLSEAVTPAFLGSFSISSLSFMPSLHSGIPLSRHFSLITPDTSALRIVPLAENKTFTSSITSMQIQFLRCTMPSGLQEVTPVACEVSCFSFFRSFRSSSLKPPSWMQFFRRDGSVNWGHPQSMTSSRISQMRENFFLTSDSLIYPPKQALQMKMRWYRNWMAMAQLMLVLVVARRTRSLQGTLMQETPLRRRTGLSRYSLVATTWAQQFWISERRTSSLKLRKMRISPLMLMKTTELIILKFKYHIRNQSPISKFYPASLQRAVKVKARQRESQFISLMRRGVESSNKVEGDFDIRSETSCSDVELSRHPSMESLDAPHDDISATIENLIDEEKKMYSSTTRGKRILYEEVQVKTRRVHSVSNMGPEKPIMRIPKHIERILGSSKKFPNVPQLDEKDGSELNSVYGAFFGFLIGDVVGSYMAYNSSRDYEYMIPNALLMNGGGTYGLGSGQGSDQTEMMFSLSYGLIEGQGTYNRNIVCKNYLDWFESKPFNFSAMFALAFRDIRKMKLEGAEIDPKKLAKIIEQSSRKNKNHESSIGFFRVLPLSLFGLRFNEADFERLIREELSIICPNDLTIESGVVYGKMLRYLFLKMSISEAYHHTSKWVYDYGSQKLLELWKAIEKEVMIPSRGNLGKLKTSFTYAFIEVNRKQRSFIDSLVRVLEKGGDTEITCSIVMTLIGAALGYDQIPGYFKQKIVNSSLRDSPRPRDEIYAPSRVFQIIERLQKIQNQRLFSIH